MSKKLIRKALEVPLDIAMEDAGISVHWWGLPFNKSGLSRYVRASTHFGEDAARTLGRNPRIERSGTFKVGIFSDPLLGQDGNDDIAALVRAAYPYADDLVRGGIRVNILTVDDGDLVQDGSFLYSPVVVNWTVWRAT